MPKNTLQYYIAVCRYVFCLTTRLGLIPRSSMFCLSGFTPVSSPKRRNQTNYCSAGTKSEQIGRASSIKKMCQDKDADHDPLRQPPEPEKPMIRIILKLMYKWQHHSSLVEMSLKDIFYGVCVCVIPLMWHTTGALLLLCIHRSIYIYIININSRLRDNLYIFI